MGERRLGQEPAYLRNAATGEKKKTLVTFEYFIIWQVLKGVDVVATASYSLRVHHIICRLKNTFSRIGCVRRDYLNENDEKQMYPALARNASKCVSGVKKTYLILRD